MDEITDQERVRAILYRDPAGSILFGIALLLIVGNAAAAFSRRIDLIEVSILLTGVFAVVGAAFGLVRGLQSGRTIKRRNT